MPSRHIIKNIDVDSYYHVYNRGVAKQDIFREPEDYATFLHLFKRHLSYEIPADKYGRPHAKLNNDIELLAFCLMPNHFHLLAYNITEKGLPNLMRRTMTAYSMYFNKRYKRVGTLFQDTYKASRITEEPYLMHISRYIHLNPQDLNQSFEEYPYSSYTYYTGKRSAKWLNTDKVLGLYGNNTKSYAKFVKDYEANRQEIQFIKHQLADH